MEPTRPDRRKRLLLAGGGLLVLLLAAVITNPPWRRFNSEASVRDLGARLEQVLADPVLDPVHVGMSVVSVESGETLFTHGADLLFHPASNLKLLTALAALEVLPHDRRFPTRIAAEAAADDDGVIRGDLYIKGYGDPEFGTDDLREMAARIAASGVRTITGDLVYDDTYFDDRTTGAGWAWEDDARRSWTPIHALTVNRNRVEVYVQAGDAVGDTLLYEMTPVTAFVDVLNQGRTAPPGDAEAAAEHRVRKQWYPVANRVLISGDRPLDDPPSTHFIQVTDGAAYCATLLSEALAAEGVELRGGLRPGVMPADAQELALHLSHPLEKILRRALKRSDTLAMELLLRAIAVETAGPPGSAEAGLVAMQEVLADLGLQEGTFRIADGSGLSRYNLISPAQMTTLLLQVHRDEELGPWVWRNLPVAGVDGTLRRRMQDGPAHRNLRAKTGTLRGVSCLSGYVTTADGELLAFSVMMSQFLDNTAEIRAVQDRLGHLMAGFRREWTSE